MLKRPRAVVLALLVRSTMSYGNEEASTHRRDARPVLAPETLEDSVHAHELTTEPPTRLRANATPATPYVQRSAVQPQAYEAPSYAAPSYPPCDRTERRGQSRLTLVCMRTWSAPSGTSARMKARSMC